MDWDIVIQLLFHKKNKTINYQTNVYKKKVFLFYKEFLLGEFFAFVIQVYWPKALYSYSPIK